MTAQIPIHFQGKQWPVHSQHFSLCVPQMKGSQKVLNNMRVSKYLHNVHLWANSSIKFKKTKQNKQKKQKDGHVSQSHGSTSILFNFSFLLKQFLPSLLPLLLWIMSAVSTPYKPNKTPLSHSYSHSHMSPLICDKQVAPKLL